MKIPPLALAIVEANTERVDGCLRWTGRLTSAGYATYGSKLLVHRWIYELLVGPIPPGYTVDHTCHDEQCQLVDDCPHRRCLDVTHMEPVERGVNVLRGNGPFARRARQTHCLRGHLLKGRNLYVRRNGTRECKRCHADREADRRAMKAAAGG